MFINHLIGNLEYIFAGNVHKEKNEHARTWFDVGAHVYLKQTYCLLVADIARSAGEVPIMVASFMSHMVSWC